MRIGIDLGGTNLRVGLVDDTGRILELVQEPTGQYEGAERFAKRLADLSDGLLQKSRISWGEIALLGVGVPGSAADGQILYTANLPLRNVPLAKLLGQYRNVPVSIGNDADCAAIGEYLFGAGRGTRNFLAVTLGTGIGAGLILNGKLYSGGGCAGEAGHMVTHPRGILCSCGRRGCWEQYASAPALRRMSGEAAARHPESRLAAACASCAGVECPALFLAAQQGDPTARRVCARYVEELVLGVTNLVNLLQPEKLAIGGGVSDAPEDLVLLPLRQKVRERCFARCSGGRLPELVKAELGGYAGVTGAAFLDRMF